MKEVKKNVEQFKEEIERLRRLVYYDELTGLFNRRGFMEEAGNFFRLVSFGTPGVERRTGFRLPFSIIFFDLDKFKRINDKYSHAVGDKALVATAKIMQQKLRTGDLYGRWGGEEFIVGLIGIDLKQAVKIADKLRRSIKQYQLRDKGEQIPLAASFGVVEYDQHETLEKLIDHADKTMYRAKTKGRDRVEAAI